MSALLYFAPLVAMFVVGLLLVFRSALPGLLRAVGLVLVAGGIGYVFAFTHWWSDSCWDVGDPPGCQGPETYMQVAWIVAVAVCVLAVGAAFVLAIRSHDGGGAASDRG